MARPFRVVHYLNQYFGGLGGEEAANLPVQVREGPVGPGRVLQQALGDVGTVVATIVCGDNYASERPEEVRPALMAAIHDQRPDVVVAGPAFEAGRYGLACGLVCRVAQEAGVAAVTAMHPENPGVLTHRQEVIIVPTGFTAVQLPTVMASLAHLVEKLARGEELGPAEVEGYIPRGIRKSGVRGQPGYRRAVDMLVAKLNGKPFTTELPVELPERVTPAAPIADLGRATIALVTTGGLIRKGNPDKQTSGNPTRFYRHNITELEGLSPKDWEAYHSGYFNHIVNSNPNYILPLSFMREFEAEGRVGGTYPWIFALPGVGTPVVKAKRFGEEIARELKEAHVDGALLVAT